VSAVTRTYRWVLEVTEEYPDGADDEYKTTLGKILRSDNHEWASYVAGLDEAGNRRTNVTYRGVDVPDVTEDRTEVMVTRAKHVLELTASEELER
jgi:hypothetical protein